MRVQKSKHRQFYVIVHNVHIVKKISEIYYKLCCPTFRLYNGLQGLVLNKNQF